MAGTHAVHTQNRSSLNDVASKFDKPIWPTCISEGLDKLVFMDGAFAAANLKLEEVDSASYVCLEAEIQQRATGTPARKLLANLNWRKDQLLPNWYFSQAVPEKDVRIDNLSHALAERYGMTGNLTQAVSEIRGPACRRLTSPSDSLPVK